MTTEIAAQIRLDCLKIAQQQLGEKASLKQIKEKAKELEIYCKAGI